MIIVKLWGGLCNQMFQYAFGYALAKKHNDKLCFDVDFFSNQPSHTQPRTIMGKEEFPNINLKFVARPKIAKMFENKYISHLIRYNVGCSVCLSNLHIVIEKLHKHYKDIPYKNGLVNYYDGYWQSALYFSEYKEQIIQVFEPDNEVKQKVFDFKKTLLPNSVAVHVRRGDYLMAINREQYATSIDSNYFLRAIDLINIKIQSPVYYFFSDDIEWCRNTFNEIVPNSVFVENKCRNGAIVDLLSISECENGIMSSSSFSWWGNYMRKAKEQSVVIYPKGDYSEEFIPEQSWIEI